MGWRTVVVDSACKLAYKNGYLVVKKEEDLLVHLSEIDVLVVATTRATVTCVLIAELVKSKVKIIFCDEKYDPLCETVAYYGNYNTSKRLKAQIGWKESQKALVFKEIVKAKIRNQAKMLFTCGRPDAAERLLGYAEEVIAGDETNREGLAAKTYFSALFGGDFSRETENSFNQSLNYGYAILLSYINREVVASGYVTQIGLKHDNAFNEFNLSCDLIEPFRQCVDAFVWNNAPPVHLDKEYKYKIIGLLNQTVPFHGRETYLCNAIGESVKSVFAALEKEDVTLLKLYEF